MPSPNSPISLDAYRYGLNPPDYRLADARLTFELLFETSTLTIDEPVGFDRLELNLERDRDWHGFNFEFTAPDTPFTFVQDDAVDFIETAYAKRGPDANVFMHWILTLGDQTLILQKLRLLLVKRKKVGRELTVTTERVSIHPDLKAGWDVPYSLDTLHPAVTTGVDTITPPLPVQIAMHAQEIVLETESKLAKLADSGWQGLPESNYYYLSFPIESFNPSEIILSADKPSATANGISTEHPFPTRPVLTPRDGGTCHIELSIDATFDLRLQLRRININAPEIRNYSIQLFMESRGELTPISTKIQGYVASRFLEGIHLTGSYSGTINIAPETGIYIYGVVTINPNRGSWKGTDVRLRTNSLSFRATSRSIAPQSLATGYLPLPALTALTALVTGQENAVRSSYYGKAGPLQASDGEGANRVLISGFALRQFQNRKAPVLSMRSLLESLSAIDAVGMGIVPTETGDKVDIEPIAHFYGDGEIIQLENYTVIQEEVQTDLIPGLVTVGYKDYPEEGPQALTEFNTQQQYQMPTRIGREVQLTSDLIASGLLLEKTRREQFSEKPVDSTSYDEKTFIVDAKPYTVAQNGLPDTTLSFLIYGKTGVVYNRQCLSTFIGVDKRLTVGMRVQVEGSDFNNSAFDYGILTVVEIRYFDGTPATIDPVTGNTTPGNPALWCIYFAEAIPTYITGLFSLTIVSATGTAGFYVPIRNEDYNLVQGIPSPETTYNLALTPRMNLLRWGRYLVGGLSFNSGSDAIRIQKSSGANLLVTQRNTLNAPIIAHASDLFVANLRTPFPLWRCEKLTIETDLTFDQMLWIRSCLQGFNPDSTLHYGYISLKDKVGVLHKAYVQSIRFIPATGATTFVLLKKRVSLSDLNSQRGCEFYQSYRFDFFESGTPVDGWIEQCQFDNFQ